MQLQTKEDDSIDEEWDLNLFNWELSWGNGKYIIKYMKNNSNKFK